MISIVLILCGAALGYLIGKRLERGKIEIERNAAEERSQQRSRRSGTVQLNSIKIRR